MLTRDRFCGQDEYHDPGADFEEVLACAVCGDNGKYFLFVEYGSALYSAKATKLHSCSILRTAVICCCASTNNMRSGLPLPEKLIFCLFQSRSKFAAEEQ